MTPVSDLGRLLDKIIICKQWHLICPWSEQWMFDTCAKTSAKLYDINVSSEEISEIWDVCKELVEMLTYTVVIKKKKILCKV